MAKRKVGKSALEAKLQRGIMTGLSAWAGLAAQKASQSAPVDTGRLMGEIKPDGAGPFEVEPGLYRHLFGVSGLEYAAAHELGSGLHSPDPADRELIVIEAGYWTGKSDKKALAFMWPGGPQDMGNIDPDTGKHIFRRVYHPGVPPYKGRGYLVYGAKLSLPEGRRIVIAALLAELRN